MKFGSVKIREKSGRQAKSRHCCRKEQFRESQGFHSSFVQLVLPRCASEYILPQLIFQVLCIPDEVL